MLPQSKKKIRKQEPLISISPHHNYYLDRPNATRKSCLERWLTSIGDDWVRGNDEQLPVIGEIAAHLRLSTAAAIDLFQNLQEFCSRSLRRRESYNYIRRDWKNLPPEITTQILSGIGPVNLTLNARRVCSSWFNISEDPCLWRSVVFSRPGVRRRVTFSVMERIYALAIRTSGGCLECVTIEEFCTDELLLYIARCSPNLRRLRLLRCKKLTHWGMEAAAKRLPFLEELEMTECDMRLPNALGNFCPCLTSFKFNYSFPFCLCCDDETYCPLDGCIIARTMPGLRHLQLLCFTGLNNKGLLAILDACTQLESLDLRNLPPYLMSDETADELEMRCVGQVKEFWSWKEITSDVQGKRWWESPEPSCLDKEIINLEALNDDYWFFETRSDDESYYHDGFVLQEQDIYVS